MNKITECKGRKILYVKSENLKPMGDFIANHHEKEIIFTTKGVFCPQCHEFLPVEWKRKEYSKRRGNKL